MNFVMSGEFVTSGMEFLPRRDYSFEGDHGGLARERDWRADAFWGPSAIRSADFGLKNPSHRADAGNMFGRTKRRNAETQDPPSLGAHNVSAVAPTKASALQAYALANTQLAVLDADSRLYLILSDTIEADGRSAKWELYYLLPSRHGEAVATVITTATPGGDYIVTASFAIDRFPRPGTIEWELAKQPIMAEMFEGRWQARLDRLNGLPIPFIDSPQAIEDMHAAGAALFSGGLVRLKGRTLPAGRPVWEAAISTGVYHVPMDFSRRA